MKSRCFWVSDSKLYQEYHDNEWGQPVYDDATLFEFLVLETFQAGLSWITILKKRENFQAAFADFDPDVIAEWGAEDVVRLLADPGIIRHRGKIEATINNARVYQEINATEGFDQFLWKYFDGFPLQNAWATQADVPPFTSVSAQISKDLKSCGFKFCGPTIVYAFLQATGLVNDHIITCHRHAQCAALAKR